MKLSHFFIDRPIFAIVISVVTVLLGCIAFTLLPVAQFPEITPPTIVVTAQYPGADPKTLSEEVAQPIEQQVNGLENMLYMSSESAADGTMQLTVTFKLGTDPNCAKLRGFGMFLTGTFFNSRNRVEQDDLAYLTHLLEEFFKPPVIGDGLHEEGSLCL
jgi:hypothetical protein